MTSVDARFPQQPVVRRGCGLLLLPHGFVAFLELVEQF
jgi:hypothetical protein